MPKPEILYRASPYRWVILGLLSFSYLLVYVHRMCPAVLAEDIMHSFGGVGGHHRAFGLRLLLPLCPNAGAGWP